MLEAARKLVEVAPPLGRVEIDGPETTATTASGHRQVTTDGTELLVHRQVTLVEVSRERL